MFSSTTTELSIRRENASARPPSTMLLIEPPPIDSAMNAASAESGIEKNTATVARMLPRKIRIMSEVRNRPMRAFVQQRLDGGLHEHATDRRPPCVTSCLGTSNRCSHRVLDAVHHRDGVGVAALLQHRHVDRALAVHAHDVGLDLLRVLGVADIGDAHRRLAHRLERQVD